MSFSLRLILQADFIFPKGLKAGEKRGNTESNRSFIFIMIKYKTQNLYTGIREKIVGVNYFFDLIP